MNYTDVFGNATLPPSEYGYASLNLTANQTTVWPYNAGSNSVSIAKILDVSCSAGVNLTLPDATQVSNGEDFLIRNTGANTLVVKNPDGTTVGTVASGAASYFYLTNNSGANGVYGVISFGVGTSTADAASLVGYGIKAIGNTLNQTHPVVPFASTTTIDSTHRSKLVVFTGGSGTFNLSSASSLGDDFFFLLRNDGTGTLTIDPYLTEQVDGLTSMNVQPGESMMLVCTGVKWYSIGYGRSVVYQFTQLTKDISAGGTITLTSSEASNKLITFIGNPSSAVTVVVPSVVAVYYTYSNISTAQTITFKTSTGSGVGINQGARIIAMCDGTNVVSAQSAVANSSLSLTDGTETNPSLYFATQTNTGLYKYGTNGVGVSTNGVNVATFSPTAITLTQPLSLSSDLAVTEGGTGVSTITGIVKGNGTSAFTAAVAGTDYQNPIGTISGIAKGNGANALTAAIAGTDYLAPSAIGSTLQGYDAATAKTNQLQTFTKSQRGAVGTANTASYDMSLTNNFTTALSTSQTIAFSNITAGQSGNIIWTVTGTPTIAKNSYVKCSSSMLATLGTAGSYWVSYYSPDGTNVYMAVTGALS